MGIHLRTTLHLPSFLPTLVLLAPRILQPAEQTPLTALRLGQLALEVGMPPGVLNIVTGLGPDAGAPLVSHKGVDKVWTRM